MLFVHVQTLGVHSVPVHPQGVHLHVAGSFGSGYEGTQPVTVHPPSLHVPAQLIVAARAACWSTGAAELSPSGTPAIL